MRPHTHKWKELCYPHNHSDNLLKIRSWGAGMTHKLLNIPKKFVTFVFGNFNVLKPQVVIHIQPACMRNRDCMEEKTQDPSSETRRCSPICTESGPEWASCNSIEIPVVPHKAVAEVSRIGNEKEIGCCESRMSEQKH